MAEPFVFQKRPNEKHDIRVIYQNDDPDITYSVVSVTGMASNSEGNDVTDEILDEESQDFFDDSAIVWVQGGTDGQNYEIKVLATMETGQEIEQLLIMKVRS